MDDDVDADDEERELVLLLTVAVLPERAGVALDEAAVRLLVAVPARV